MKERYDAREMFPLFCVLCVSVINERECTDQEGRALGSLRKRRERKGKSEIVFLRCVQDLCRLCVMLMNKNASQSQREWKCILGVSGEIKGKVEGGNSL